MSRRWLDRLEVAASAVAFMALVVLVVLAYAWSA